MSKQVVYTWDWPDRIEKVFEDMLKYGPIINSGSKYKQVVCFRNYNHLNKSGEAFCVYRLILRYFLTYILAEIRLTYLL